MTKPSDEFKRRRTTFKNIFRNYLVWKALIEKEGPEKSVLEIDGEEIHFYDLMAGYDSLPPRQKEAFDLSVLQGMSEWQAAQIMFPGTRWSTPVQQYSKSALGRMMAAYDRVQTKEGRKEQAELTAKSERKRRRAEERKRRRELESRPPEETDEDTKKVRDTLFD